MTPLCELGEKYHTDKVIAGYTAYYHSLFQDRRAQVKRVLEIGIGTLDTMTHQPDYVPGASLRMWEEYFPNAEVYGLDIDLSVLINEGRIHSHYANQRSAHDLEAAIKWLGSDFDLIIDDGEHTSIPQLIAVHTLMPTLNKTGVYIIEDAKETDLLLAGLSDTSYVATPVNLDEGGKLLMVTHAS